MEKNEVPESILQIYELNKINEKLEDPEVTRVLKCVTLIMAKRTVPANKAVDLIVELQAIAFNFHLKYKYYMLLGKGEPDAQLKKNLYASLAEATKELVSAIKYVQKA